MKALEQYITGLVISQGRHAGQPFRLLPWQRRLLRGAFSQPRDSAFTMGRGGGKTTLVAALGAASVDVDGPLVEPRAECLIIASSFDQGLICFRHVQAFMEPTFEKYGTGPRGRFRIQDSANRATITDRETGAMLRVLGSDPRRLHGAAPKLLLYDEVAQWPPERLPAHVGRVEDEPREGAGEPGDLARHPPRHAGAPLSARARRPWCRIQPRLRRWPRRSTFPASHLEAGKSRPRPLAGSGSHHPAGSRRRPPRPRCASDVPRPPIESGCGRRATVSSDRRGLMGTRGTAGAGGHGGPVRPRARPRAVRSHVRGGRVLARSLPARSGRRLSRAPRPRGLVASRMALGMPT